MPDQSLTDPIVFKPAVRAGVGLFIGINGGTGSGKSYTALRLARGIVGPEGKIAAGDTEGRRMSHYCDRFKFDVVDILPPFRPQKFMDLAKNAEAGGYGCLIIDSFSHEHAGEGGVLEWHDEELDRAVVQAQQRAEHPELVNEEAIRNAQNMRGWIKPKAAHKLMVNSFLQRTIPIIFCMRAEEKIKVLGNGKPVPMGWMPICDKNFGYELTVMITLSNEKPGKVDYTLPRKIAEHHLHLFPDNQFITEKAGAALAAWARGEDISGKPKEEPKPAAPKETVAPKTDRTTAIVDGLIVRMKTMKTPAEVDAIFSEEIVAKQIEWMKTHRKDQYDRAMKEADDINMTLNQPPESTPTTPPETGGDGRGE